jgi:hypothetical protein
MVPTTQELVDKLIYPCWQGVSATYKSKYRRNIWDQFGEAIKSSAYTDRLALFLERLTVKLAIEIVGKYTEGVASIVNCGEDRVVLTMLRTETTLLVIMCRLENEKRREAAKDAKERWSGENLTEDELPNDDKDFGRNSQGALFNQS